MGDLTKLQAGYALLKQGTLWSSAGKCKGYAASNPAEAAQIDSYVAGLVAGGNPIVPALATATGRGLVEIIQGGYAPSVTPPLAVTITGTPQVPDVLTANATGG